MTEFVATQAYRWDQKASSFVSSPQIGLNFSKARCRGRGLRRRPGCPGSALAVGLTLWRLSGATKSKTVRLANSETEVLGVGRSANSRALLALEQAGLVIVERRPGCLPKATILDV